MSSVLEYALYAVAFIAVVLGIEGLARLIRSAVGEDRKVRKRLAKARPTVGRDSQGDKTPSPDRISHILLGRLPGLGRMLEQAGAPFSAAQMLIGAMIALVIIFIGLNALGVPSPIALAVSLCVSIGGTWVLLSSLVARRRGRFLDQMPQAVDLIARSLQAGHPVGAAMTVVGKRMAAPLGPEFQVVVEEMTYGLDRDAALSNMIRRFPVPELRMFVASLEVTRESGGNLAEVFLKLAEQIRAKARFRQKVAAITAEGRLSFWVISALPLVVGGVLMLIRPSFYLDVAKDPLFWPLMSLSPACLVIGSAIIWRMVNLKV